MSLTRAVHAEWTKQRTVSATAWLLLATVVALAALGPAVVSSIDPAHCPPDGCPRDLVRVSLTGTWIAHTTAALVGVLAATTEFATQTVVPTLASAPRRLRVVLSKVLVVAAVTTGSAVAGVAAAFAVSRRLASRSQLTPAGGYSALDLSSGPLVRALAGTVLYLVAVALLGLGIGLLLRETAWAATTVLSVLHAVPVLISFVSDPDWNERLQAIAPTAGLAIQATLGLAALPIAPWPGLVVTAGYATVALVAGAVALVYCDA